MGQKQSKDRLLYQYVVNSDIEGIQFLSKQGASLEWKDKEGKTPLIVAAKDRTLYGVAALLIELGANVNAICKGSHGGTPLHYAAKEGLNGTVALLLSHGANAFVKNKESRTPLDVARKNGRNLVVREIEGRICYFSGYIRESFGPGFSDASALQMSTRVIWVVVVPCSLHKPPKRPKLELVIYSTPQDAEPRKIVSLRRCKIKEPRFDQPSPALMIFDKQTKTRYKLSPVTYSDKQQLRRLYNACKGISQVKPASALMSSEPWDLSAQPTPEVMHARNSWDYTVSSPSTWRSTIRLSPPMTPLNNPWIHESPRMSRDYIGQGVTGSWSAPHLSPQSYVGSQMNPKSPALQTPDSTAKPGLYPDAASEPTVPSAPPLTTDRTTTTAATAATATAATTATTTTQVSAQNRPDSSSCVVCWEAPVEAACVPCGHVSACMSCLQEIKDKNGVCPLCRSQIDQVMKLYGV